MSAAELLLLLGIGVVASVSAAFIAGWGAGQFARYFQAQPRRGRRRAE